jgi:hypothetical protein
MESSMRRRKEDNNFLGRKREAGDISTNLIFRKSLTGTLEGEYENTFNNFRGLCSFDWEDEKIVKNKQHPSKINLIN